MKNGRCTRAHRSGSTSTTHPVQYLVPLADAFREQGVEVVVTARDYGNALELLSQRTSSFAVVGREFGRSRTAKVTGVLRRARSAHIVARRPPPAARASLRVEILDDRGAPHGNPFVRDW